ncbi:hypothetical protein C8R43DRAFT_919823 [Mycena crocata]|nr:hypothetical protein C8R43DRAFT_919823 [Mycena crocata]
MQPSLIADRQLLADLDAQISALEPTLLLLRNKVQRRLDAYTYPVLTLPGEIISEIFLHTLPNYPLCPPAVGLRSPTTLGQICHEWREIVFSTPMLWRAFSTSGIRPRNVKGTGGVYHQCLQLLKTWLVRSGSCPLSIELAADITKLWSQEGDLLSALLPHFSRLEHFKARSKLDLSHSACSDIHYAMTGLRSLELLHHLETGADSALVEAFGHAPHLRTVVLNGMYGPSTISLPWSQLTKVVLDHILPSHCAGVLKHTVSLVHCVLAVTGYDLGGHLDDIPPLTCLESLEIFTADAWSHDTFTTPLLSTLTLPALRSLKVAEGSEDSDFIDKLVSFVAQSRCSLDKLHILSVHDVGMPAATRVSPEVYRTAFPTVPTMVFSAIQEYGRVEHILNTPFS